MLPTARVAAALGRGIVGAFAGTMLCLALTVLVGQALAYYPPNDRVGTQVFLAAAVPGGTAGATLAVVVGRKEVRGRARDVSVGLVAGALAGILARSEEHTSE